MVQIRYDRARVGLTTLNGRMAVEIELDSVVADYRIATWDGAEVATFKVIRARLLIVVAKVCNN